jgi:hypothetical protein
MEVIWAWGCEPLEGSGLPLLSNTVETKMGRRLNAKLTKQLNVLKSESKPSHSKCLLPALSPAASFSSLALATRRENCAIR